MSIRRVPEEWELRHTTYPLCPHCGHWMRDAWELDMDDEQTEQVWCEGCDETYIVRCHVSVTYTTEKFEEER